MEYEVSLYVGDAVNLPKLSPKQFNAYRDEQAALRRIINERCVTAGRKPIFTCPMDDFSKWAVIPRKDGSFSMVKREKPLDIAEFDNNGQAAVIANMAKGYAERVQLTAKRGKYNDEDNVLGVSSGFQETVEVGEVQAFASI